MVQAKKFVESLPQEVKGGISKEEANKLAAALEAVGGTVEIVWKLKTYIHIFFLDQILSSLSPKA